MARCMHARPSKSRAIHPSLCYLNCTGQTNTGGSNDSGSYEHILIIVPALKRHKECTNFHRTENYCEFRVIWIELEAFQVWLAILLKLSCDLATCNMMCLPGELLRIHFFLKLVGRQRHCDCRFNFQPCALGKAH